MSVGFMMNRDVLQLEVAASANPFELQNSIVKLATGTQQDIFTRQPVSVITSDTTEIVQNEAGTYTYTVTGDSDDPSATFSYDGVAGAYLYGYARNGSIKTITALSDGVTADSGISAEDYPILFPMGNGQEGSTLDAELRFKSDQQSGAIDLQVYALGQEAFEQAYAELADEQLELTDFSDTRLKGRINVKRRGVLYLSIPYERGWSVYVDGKKTSTFKVFDAMLGAEIGPGEHEIELRYFPEGLVSGLVISCSAAALLLLLLLSDISRKRRKKRAAAEAPAEPGDNNNGMEDVFI